MPFKYLLALLCPGVANLFQEEARQFSASGSENLGMAVLVRKQFCVFPFSTTSCSSPSLKCDCMYGSLSPSESMCLFVVLLLGFEARQAGGTIHPIVPFQQHLTAPKGEREREPVWSREWRMEEEQKDGHRPTGRCFICHQCREAGLLGKQRARIRAPWRIIDKPLHSKARNLLASSLMTH